MNAAVRVIDVGFRYEADSVLDGVTFDLPGGSLAALIGPNGVGKSTLLQLICGSLRPDRGCVELDGRDVGRYPPRERARRIAFVPQTLAIPFAFTVREFVALGRTPYLRPLRGERTSDREAIERALALTGTDGYAGRSVLELSGGERQRVILALALAQEPDLLLLDEPTANLDIAHQVGILGVVRELNRAHGMTVLAAIHDLNLAALFFGRLLALDRGRIAADGPPRAVLTPARIEALFGSRVFVVDHPSEPVPQVALSAEG